MTVLLLVLVCGAYDCHYERHGLFDSLAACQRAGGIKQPTERIAIFKCVQVKGG